MTQTIDYDELVSLLRCAGKHVKSNREHLSRLDSHGGDGDHGTTMARAMDQMEKAIEDHASRDFAPLLEAIGWSILGVDGGATGPLFGSLFLAMAEAAADSTTLDAGGLADLFEAGLAGVRKRTRAEPGDKTMIDALVPAVEALRNSSDRGEDLVAAMRCAADAADAGAGSTEGMRARFGRAKNLGEKSVGSIDPGAASVSLIFRGFQEGLDSLREE